MKSRNTSRWIRNSALFVALSILSLTTAAFAQTANQANVNATGSENRVMARDDDDDTNWGWVGLLGLAGLLGLLPKKREVVTRERDVNADRR